MARNVKALWVTIPILAITILLLGVSDVLAQAAVAPNTAVGKLLAAGSAQAVLSVVCLSMGAVVVWQARQMKAIQDARVQEVHSLMADTVTKSTEALTSSAEAQQQGALAMHRVATVIDKCEAVHKSA